MVEAVQAKMDTIVTKAENIDLDENGREQFIINNIDMSVGPSNIHVFDDNYIYKQSFLRSSSVFCFRSKYSQTKVILNFPFYIDTNEGNGSQTQTDNCIKLAAQLNAYPYTFIKSTRLETYISPKSKSSTGYLMFAVESIASIQSATASNLVFLEVTLQYFNHTPFASDFQFIDKRQVNMISGDIDPTLENYESLVITPPVFVTNLGESTVWSEYISPKENKVMDKLLEAGLYDFSDYETRHPGLSVSIDVPIISENVDRGVQMMSEDDGSFVGPDSKIITTTDINKMDSTDFTEDMLSTFSQDFSRQTAEERKLNRSKALYGEANVNDKLKKEAEQSKEDDSMIASFIRGMTDESTISTPTGSVDLFVQYAPINLEELGVTISKLEVRKTNNLISQRIGSHKHPIIQYMGKNPAEIHIQFSSNVEPDFYKGDISSKPAHTLLTNALQILDENRLLQPAAEAYNVLKIKSFSTYLLGANSAVPNSNMISAIADAQGTEELALSLVESNTEEFLQSLKHEASGAKSEDNVGISNLLKAAAAWLRTFKQEFDKQEMLVGQQVDRLIVGEDVELAISYAKELISLVPDMIQEMGFVDLSLEYFTAYGYEKLSAEGLLTTAKMNKTISFSSFPPSSRNVGVNNNLHPEYKYYKEVEDAYDNILLSNPGPTKGVNSTMRQYFSWYLGFASLWFTTRYHLINNLPNSPVAIGNPSDFNRSTAFENKLTDLMLKISRNKEEKLVAPVIDKGTIAFLSTLAITSKHEGYLRGQNLPDLDLQDAIPEYVEGDDLVVHALDPFFFLYSAPLLDNDMETFFFDNYNVEELNPDPINKETEDISKSEPDMMEEYLGIDFKDRQLKEVNYNSKEFESYYSALTSSQVSLNSTVGGETLASNPNVSKAIDQALSEYGYSNDPEMVEYAHKVAFVESTYGIKLGNPNSSALGLYQFLEGTTAEVVSNTKSKAFNNTPYKGTSESNRYAVAREIRGKASFRTDHLLSARMFLDLFNISGGKVLLKNGKMDMAATYGKHHYGLGGYNSSIKVYLTTGKNVPIAQHGNAANFYQKYTATFNKIDVNKLRGKEDTANSTTVRGVPFKQTGVQYSAIVKKIVDGDTADIQLKLPNNILKDVRIRIESIDTRETDTKSVKFKAEYLKWAQAAKTKLGMLMPVNSKVVVNYLTIERYDRGVNRVTNAQNVDVSLAMIEAGLVTVSTNYASNHQYVAAQTKAQRDKVGMWSDAISPEAAKKAEDKKEVVKKAEEDKKFDVTEILSGATSNTNQGKWQKWQPFSDRQNATLKSDFTYGGARKDMNRASPHRGIDLSVPTGTTVISAAAGKVIAAKVQVGEAGLYVKIDHGNGFTTTYMHLTKLLVKEGTTVKAHQPIATSGGDPKKDPVNAGGSTGAHLHYEVRFKNRAIHPYSTRYTLDKYTGGEYFNGEGNPAGSLTTTGDIQNQKDTTGYLNREFTDRVGITPFNTVFNKEILARTILRNAKDTINTGMKYSLPAIRVYMTVGNENDGLGLDTITSGVQYYEVKGIKSFNLVCNNDTSPVDTALMTILDPSFANTDAWTSLSTMGMPGIIDVDKIGTDSEMQFKIGRVVLKPGNKLQVRLGYGNDPNKLPTVFNGVIVEAARGDNNQIMNLLLEGFGRELLGDMLGTTAEPEKLDGDHNSSTSNVIGKVISSADAISHFGHMSTYIKLLYQNDYDPEERQLTPFINTGAFGFFNTDKAIFKSRVYSNIFAPEIEKVDDEFSKYFRNFFPSFGMSNHQFGYPFFMYRTNAWASCKQMEYRHPGTIFKPLIFEDRMTLFYGVKEQMYIAKDLSTYTQVSAIKEIKNYQRSLATTSNDYAIAPVVSDETLASPGENTVDYFARRRERLEPVSNIHIVSSTHNLLYNHTKLNGQWKSASRVSYFTDNDDFSDQYAWKTTKVSFDDNLLPWEVREKELRMSGIHGAYTSFLYGTTDLKKEAETMYGGSIVILGNPKLKSGDYIFLDDYDNRMSGMILVRDCIHHFDSQRGFITEITPGAYVEPAQFIYNTLWLQLMTAFKLGAVKTRIVNSSAYSSEYRMIKDYLSVMKELRNLDGIGDVEKGTGALIGAYAAGGALAGYILLKIAKQLGIEAPKRRFLGSHTAKYAWDATRGMLDKSHRELALKRVQMSTAHGYFKKGTNFSKNYANIKKAAFIGSEGYQAYRKSRAGRTVAVVLRGIKRNKLVGMGIGTVKYIASPFAKASWFVARGALTALALSNPIGLLLEAIFALVVSYGMAKVEETQMTRQPLLIFPLISHGRPYVAGMAGAKRNSYLAGMSEEVGKTVGQVSKAAAILNANRIQRGKGSLTILESIGAYHSSAISESRVNQMNATIQKEVNNDEVEAAK